MTTRVAGPPDRPQKKLEIRGYCAQCSSGCPVTAVVTGKKLSEIRSDPDHPNANRLCPKGLAGPEMVYDPLRLRHPLRRTRPKGSADPGWEPMGWDAALNMIADRLLAIRSAHGPEAVAFARACPGGSAIGEILPWVLRLAHAFGSPNNVATTHICQWHRDQCSRYTFGTGHHPKQYLPDFRYAGCILLWGNNPHATRRNYLREIRQGIANGARLIVVDPRKIPLAETADIWLPIRPATDGLLALSMIHVMIEEKLFDADFVRDWTTAPLLVREDTGDLLQAGDLADGGMPDRFVMVDSITRSPMAYEPGKTPPEDPELEATLSAVLGNGDGVACSTVFRLLRRHVADYAPEATAGRTGLKPSQVKAAARLFCGSGPSCLYTYNGIEQNTNASQTNRAIAILYALTGSFDARGGNVIFPETPLNEVSGGHLLNPEVAGNRLGRKERPLGPARSPGAVRANDVYEAILNGRPYPVKALVGLGGNLLTSNPDSPMAAEALEKLDFHVQSELYMTPTARYADIVLPASTFWESWGVKANFMVRGATTHIQYRPRAVEPLHDSRPNLEIIFDLASRLGLGDRFWQGNIDAAYNHMLSPSGITVADLKQALGGITVEAEISYQKYSRKDGSGLFSGFETPSRRIELYAQIFKDYGFSPLPVWHAPASLSETAMDFNERFPLTLVNNKLLHFCQGQHRSVKSLRNAVPEPRLEISHRLASELGIRNGQRIKLKTPHGDITLKADPSDSLPHQVVCFQHGWWQACDALGLPAYDTASAEGANMNRILKAEASDPISGSIQIKGIPCTVCT